jgi:hypothetical protein
VLKRIAMSTSRGAPWYLRCTASPESVSKKEDQHMRKYLSGIILLVAVSAVPALAHHPFAAEYDWKKPMTITGTVTSFNWENPHTMLVVKGRDDSGAEAEWTVELGSPGRLSRFGWTTRQLKAGDRVSVDGWLAKSGQKHLSAKSVTLPGGRELPAASSFFEEGESTAITNPNKRQASAIVSPH